jgi:hypothetical protein
MISRLDHVGTPSIVLDVAHSESTGQQPPRSSN